MTLYTVARPMRDAFFFAVDGPRHAPRALHS